MSKEYIERKALLDQDFTYKCINIDDISIIEKLIKNVPAADVEPVRHGEWIVTKTEFGWNSAEYPVEYTCSFCGRTESQEEPYCHCGARMDGSNKVVKTNRGILLEKQKGVKTL